MHSARVFRLALCAGLLISVESDGLAQQSTESAEVLGPEVVDGVPLVASEPAWKTEYLKGRRTARGGLAAGYVGTGLFGAGALMILLGETGPQSRDDGVMIAGAGGLAAGLLTLSVGSFVAASGSQRSYTALTRGGLARQGACTWCAGAWVSQATVPFTLLLGSAMSMSYTTKQVRRNHEIYYRAEAPQRRRSRLRLSPVVIDRTKGVALSHEF